MLSLTQPALRMLQATIRADVVVPGELACRGDTWPVLVRYRGNHARTAPLLSYELRFPDVRFHGQRTLHLNAHFCDSSRLRNRLSLDLFAVAGCPAPAAWHTELWLNQEAQGVYTAAEAVDELWFKRRGRPATAIYYAVTSAANFGPIHPYTGAAKIDPAQGYEQAYPTGGACGDDLRDLIRFVTRASDNEFAGTIGQMLDAEAYLRWLATAVFIGHYDGFCQNYALCRLADGPWVVLPWDCDATWGRTAEGRALGSRHLPSLNGSGNYLSERLLQSPAWRNRYREVFVALLGEAFAPTTLARSIDSLFGEIWASVRRHGRNCHANRLFEQERAFLKRFAVTRHRCLTRALRCWAPRRASGFGTRP